MTMTMWSSIGTRPLTHSNRSRSGPSVRLHALVLINALLLFGGVLVPVQLIQGFFLPGIKPHSFTDGQPIKLKVNKLTSIHEEYPIEYYHLPFCQPEDGIQLEHENLGEFLSGDRIENSPFRIKMKTEMYCEQLCIMNLKYDDSRNKLRKAIGLNYHNNWIIDNLPSASRVTTTTMYDENENDDKENKDDKDDKDDTTVLLSTMTKYYQGFPIGFVEKNKNHSKKHDKKHGHVDDGLPSDDYSLMYVNNHVNIEIEYHEVEKNKSLKKKTLTSTSASASVDENNDEQNEEEREYRIVRFTVEPFSIKHEFTHYMNDDDDDERVLYKVANIKNPITSCNPKYSTSTSTSASSTRTERKHTNFEMTHSRSKDNRQLAEGEILFTYDVIWKENKEVSWASRWDIYLSMNGAAEDKIHWVSITNSLIIVFMLTSVLAVILVKNLRSDYERYSKVLDEEEEETGGGVEETGWKLVHADVFRPPSYPMVMAVFCGSGVQILCMSVFTLIFAVMGFSNPARRGSLIMALLILYVLMGGVAGYVSAHLYKSFKGKKYQRSTIATAFGFPSLAFTLFFVMNMLAMTRGSGDAVPFLKMVQLLLLWFGVSVPLVFIGAFFGFKADVIECPVVVNKLPRPVPDQPWYLKRTTTTAFSGILSFGACFIELHFILSSIWMEEYYYIFGFLFLTFSILLVTVAEISIIMNYRQLCSENYHWWWRSFLNGGAPAIYTYLFCLDYFKNLESNSFATYILYHGYMGLACFGLFLAMGSVGMLSCLWFNKKIFGALRID